MIPNDQTTIIQKKTKADQRDFSLTTTINELITFTVGYLYPTSMRINKDGTLAVNFRTEARFRGQFVQSHPGRNATCSEYTEDVLLETICINYTIFYYMLHMKILR